MSIAVTARKYGAVFSTYIQDSFAYRASMYIWLLTDLVPVLVMPMVWLRSYNGRADIAGYSPSQMVMYYLVIVCLTSFITSHLMWDIAVEIKEGMFSVALLRPFSFFQFQVARNFAWRVMRTMLFLPLGVVLLWIYRSYIDWSGFYLGWQFWTAVVLGHMLSFVLVFSLALLALWVQEVYSIFGLYYIPMLFLSGQLTPLSVLPDWAGTIAKLLPFKYTTALPAEILVGRVSPSEATTMLLGPVVWIGLVGMFGRYLWTRGLKRYTGVGM